jgi:hypothetical protein
MASGLPAGHDLRDNQIDRRHTGNPIRDQEAVHDSSIHETRTAGVIAAAMLTLGGIATTAGAKPIDAAPVGLSMAAPPSQIAIIHHVDAQEAQRLPSGPPRAIEQSNADTSSTNGFDYRAGAVGVIAVIALLIAAGKLTIRRRSQPEHT